MNTRLAVFSVIVSLVAVVAILRPGPKELDFTITFPDDVGLLLSDARQVEGISNLFDMATRVDGAKDFLEWGHFTEVLRSPIDCFSSSSCGFTFLVFRALDNGAPMTTIYMEAYERIVITEKQSIPILRNYGIYIDYTILTEAMVPVEGLPHRFSGVMRFNILSFSWFRLALAIIASLILYLVGALLLILNDVIRKQPNSSSPQTR